MKLSNLTAALGVLAFGSFSVQAQYFSEGWKPGQPAQETSVAEPQATYVPGEGVKAAPEAQKAPVQRRTSLFELLDPEKLLGTVLEKAGFNVSAALDQKIWDERIPLITDDNYKDLIVNEQFASEQEARDRTWALVVTVSQNRQEPLSKLVDEMFDSAYNKSILAGDLPNIRWGRIDYFNVTYLTTKWNVWKAPYLIILRDRGQTLHFFRPGTIRINDDAFREFLKTEGFMTLPPWSGIWAPGGEREWLIDLFAVWMAKVYNITTKIPRWILFLATGGIGSLVLSFLHKPAKPSVLSKTTTVADAQKRALAQGQSSESTPTPKSVTSPTSETSTNSNQRTTPASPGKRSNARQRKGKKAAA